MHTLNMGMSGIPGAPSFEWLVDNNRMDEALRIYYAAVTHILEFKLVEILKQLHLSEWAISSSEITVKVSAMRL